MQEAIYPVKVFVYGTLKRGGPNHDVMARANGVFLCEAKTKELRRLIVQGLPYLCDGFAEDGHHVEGEIYEIPDAEGLALVDSLESNGTFYRRRIDAFVECAVGDDEPIEHSAWVYYILQNRDGDPQARYNIDN